MYTKHFGLKKLPFENVPDPAFFFNRGDHSRIRTRITESLKAGRGLIIVTGPMGSGKTTLSQMLIADFQQETKLIWMAMPPDDSMDLFLFLAQELGRTPASSERTFVLRDIREALLQRHSQQKKSVMIIDESHLMSDDAINAIRLLNNLEHGSVKLVQILLLGQEELLTTINRPELEPFKQRIATLEILGQMDCTRIREYISHRVQVAGGQPSIFAETGWEALSRAFSSGGTPRTINSLCDRTLSIAFDKAKKQADVDDVYEAAEGMGLQKEIFFYKIELKQGGGGHKVERSREDIVAMMATEPGEERCEEGGSEEPEIREAAREKEPPAIMPHPVAPEAPAWDQGKAPAAAPPRTTSQAILWESGKNEERHSPPKASEDEMPPGETPQSRASHIKHQLIKPKRPGNFADKISFLFQEDPERTAYFILISSLIALALSIYFYLQVST